MCGIVGAVAERNVSSILLEGLQRLEYRGYDSAGIAVLSNGGKAMTVRKRAGKVRELADSLSAKPLRGRVGIAHTRWATHGSPSERNAHPHSSNGRISLVHNGIVENFEALRAELQAQGYEFASETDTEVIAHLIDFHCKGGQPFPEAFRAAVGRLEGANALGAISRDAPDRLLVARAGNPLVVGKGIGENYIASDVLALKPVTDRFVILEEGDWAEITTDQVAIRNSRNEPAARPAVKVEMAGDDADKGSYRHYMQKEIFEQPKVLANTLAGRIGKKRVLEQAFGPHAASVFDRAQSVALVACGTSYYAASIARYWIEEQAGIPCSAEIASEFRYRKGVVPPDSLFVTVCQSGETADTLAALRIAKSRGHFATLTLCNVATSSCVRESDLALMTQAGPEIGVASTKAFTAQLADLLLLTTVLGRRRGLGKGAESRLVAGLRGLASSVQGALALHERIRELAEQFAHRHHALFLGRGTMYPIALEGALKLKEVSYIHAEGYPAGELKHGPLALVDEDMPVVAVAPNNQLLEKLQSNLQEVRARGGELFVFADRKSGFRDGPGITLVQLPEVDPLLAPIVYAVPLQLLAYYVALLKGTDVDQPRNLAKSVTVE